MRVCAICNVRDGEIALPGSVEGETEHLVQPELIFMRTANEITPRQARKGWTYKSWQGRHARYRMICGACLLASDEMERDARTVKKQHIEIERQAKGQVNRYQIYCEPYV